MSIKYERDIETIWDSSDLHRLIRERDGTDWRLVGVIETALVWERAKAEPPARPAAAAALAQGWLVCGRCDGEGRVLMPDDSKTDCYECNGRGRLRADKVEQS